MKRLDVEIATKIEEFEAENDVAIGKYTIEKDYFVTDTINIIQSIPASDYFRIVFCESWFHSHAGLPCICTGSQSTYYLIRPAIGMILWFAICMMCTKLKIALDSQTSTNICSLRISH